MKFPTLIVIGIAIVATVFADDAEDERGYTLCARCLLNLNYIRSVLPDNGATATEDQLRAALKQGCDVNFPYIKACFDRNNKNLDYMMSFLQRRGPTPSICRTVGQCSS
uniref:Saposin B-type domain-containing protein n=1 Tax=Panagrellus redivivus TaxID=6233 RepID=A0A7E4V3I3_PANRE